ncbi:MAG: 4Fe-4S binding protein [Candidatus Latescibacteria bacterium]|jgi:formate dehydrogenase (coenzyme F420) beta subunit|nr:4Fe-4S binding protein [Candidatus Latescibacterota bacterium]
MEKLEADLKKAVRDLFASNKIDLLIGHESGTLPLHSRPCFISSANETDKLVMNSYCSYNLAVYLPRLFQISQHRKVKAPLPKVGIVAKGCDMRSIVGLVREKQVPRENIVIIGVPCKGIVDLEKVNTLMGGDIPAESKENQSGILTVTTKTGSMKEFTKEEIILNTCHECQFPLPKDADVLIEGKSKKINDEKYTKVEEFEARPPEERWEYFLEEISKCIRCYACRQACPNCYCKECFAEQIKDGWIGAGNDLSDLLLYHIGRIFHQAGRCVGCDACVRACPMDIDLRTFTLKLVKDSKELFDYVPGFSVEEPAPLCTFREDDNQDFISEP